MDWLGIECRISQLLYFSRSEFRLHNIILIAKSIAVQQPCDREIAFCRVLKHHLTGGTDVIFVELSRRRKRQIWLIVPPLQSR